MLYLWSEHESTFHALFVSCSIYSVGMVMRDIWDVPGEEVFKHSESDRFLIHLDQLSAIPCDQIIFIFLESLTFDK